MKYELASIVFTVYNQEQYVRESLSSALNQTYEPLEIVVSDDGSTDNTKQIILATLKDSDFEPVGSDNTVVDVSGVGIFRKGKKTVIVNFNVWNRGICPNFEYAFGLTHGELVFTFGGDDISMPERVATMMARWVSEGKKSHVLASGGWLMDIEGNNYREYRREVLDGAPVGAFNAYSRCVFDDFPRIAPALASQTYEDSIYGLRAQFFAPPLYVDELLVRYRFGSGVSTGGEIRHRMSRGAKAVKASCQQLLADLASLDGLVPDDVILERRAEFTSRIEHEESLLALLEGTSIGERWRGYVACGYPKMSLKMKSFGMILVLPDWVSRRLCHFLRKILH